MQASKEPTTVVSNIQRSMNFRRQSKDMRSNSAQWAKQYGGGGTTQNGTSISHKSPNQTMEKLVPSHEPTRLKEREERIMTDGSRAPVKQGKKLSAKAADIASADALSQSPKFKLNVQKQSSNDGDVNSAGDKSPVL